MGQLIKLNSLSLSKNQLTGEIPVELSKLNLLTLFALSDNELVGEVPPELAELKATKQFYIYNNCLTVSLGSKDLKAFLKERDSSTRRKREGCADIMAAAQK